MKKKKIYLFTALIAGIALTGCSSDESIAEAPPVTPPVEEEIPIVFSSNKGNITRGDITGAAAADLLGKQFVVSGYKGQNTGSVVNMVFDNYVVKYAENTAHTTESNEANWEYVGQERIKHAIDHGVTQQAIKYWDYIQPQYDFIAWSTGTKTAIYEGTPSTGQVLVSAIVPADKATAAFTMEGSAADLTDCYIADLVTVKKADYGNPVTIRFRSLGSKVRIGIYETVPGYSVKDVQFYDAAVTTQEAYDADTYTNATPKLFTTTANDIYTQGKYTIYYPTVDDPDNADNNQAHIKFEGTGTQSTIVNFGGLNYTIAEDGEKTAGRSFLGRSSNTASMAGNAEGNYYTAYLPNEGGTNLNLRVNYTLESIDGTGETIVVKGATAQVPSVYTQWKAGFAYTYLFKISDKTNGYTGVYDPTQPDNTSVNSDPAGLFPITFDAVVVNDEDNDQTQETITLVSTPSITTYQSGSTVVNNNEYTVLAADPTKGISGDIYVTVNDGNAESTPDLANGKLQTLTGKVALYIIPEGTTEAEVIDALQYQDDAPGEYTIMGRNKIGLKEAKDATDNTKNLLTLTNEVAYGVDGNTISVETDQAAKFTPSAATTYAFVYTKKGATTTTNKFQPVTKTQGASVSGLYRYKVENAASGDVQKGVTYFTGNQATFEKTTVFLGQDVSNMYTRTGTGTDADPYVYTAASGYAVTGTKYYYTTDNGMSYTEAASIGYTKIAEYTFYTFDGTDYTEVTDKSGMPEANTAYYYKKSDGKYYYCVFFPQRTQGGTSLMVATDEKVACTGSETAVDGMTYFDMYTRNDGVYYTKVIKVQ